MAVADRASAGRLSAVIEVCGDHFKLQVQDGLHEAYLNATSDSRDSAPHETGEDSLNEMCAGREVGHSKAHRHRRLAVIPGKPRES